MPELPDVETFRRYANSTSLRQKIRKTSELNKDMLTGVSARALQRRLKDHMFCSTERVGKYLFLRIGDEGWLMLHFGMTGRLDYSGDDDDIPDHTQALFTFASGSRLAYVCPRKLGKIGWVDSPEEFAKEQDLGVDALDLDEERFLEVAEDKTSMVKSLLMDQTLIAGIGNIYSDEILFQSRIHPRKKVNRLSGKELRKLYRTARKVLQEAVKRGADTERFPESWLIHKERGKAPCPRCGSEVRQTKIGSRSAYFCPKCQKR